MKITIAMALLCALLATAQDSKDSKDAKKPAAAPQTPEMTDVDRARVRLLLMNSENVTLFARQSKLNFLPANLKSLLDTRLSERTWLLAGPIWRNRLSPLLKVATNWPLENVSGLLQSPSGFAWR